MKTRYAWLASTLAVVLGTYAGAAHAESALRWAARLAHDLGARLAVVHAAGLLEHAAGRAGAEHKRVVDQVAAVLILESFLAARRTQSGG